MAETPLSILYPRKCVLCRSLLTKEETDLCTPKNRAGISKSKKYLSFCCTLDSFVVL